jgi:predicted RNA-binding Zn-ribbon protein involved in translation (DUF1610 family)
MILLNSDQKKWQCPDCGAVLERTLTHGRTLECAICQVPLVPNEEELE